MILTRKKFASLSVDDITDSTLTAEIQKASIYLTFKWTQRAQVVIFKLGYRVGTGDWTDALNNKPIADDDGTETVYIGDFPIGTEIEFETAMMAISTVARAAIIISQENPKAAHKIKPPGPNEFKALAASEKWRETFKYKVYAPAIA